MPPESPEDTLGASLTEKHAKLLDGATRMIEAADRIPIIIEDEENAGKASDFIKMVTGLQKGLEAERVNEKEPYLRLGRAVDGFFKVKIDALSTAAARAKRPLDTFLKKKAAEEQRRRQDEANVLRQRQEEEARAAQLLANANLAPEADKVMDQAVITEQQAAKAQQAAEAKPADMTHSRGESGARAALVTTWKGEIIDQALLDLNALRFHINPEALQKALNSFVKAGGRELVGARIFEDSQTVVR